MKSNIFSGDEFREIMLHFCRFVANMKEVFKIMVKLAKIIY